ncbi:unannotated protein [freshwater metagenome]|uniref:Unannotated protein n=1 Tax=freshwater metagenome TaxID=449393 RepID=A0A6J6PX67_9ZZZZ
MHAVFAGHGLERLELLKSCLAQAFVAADAVGGAGWLALFVEVWGIDGDVLPSEAIFGPCLSGTLLAQQAERIGVFAADAPLVGDALGALEL